MGKRKKSTAAAIATSAENNNSGNNNNNKRAAASCVIPNLLYLGPVEATSNAAFLTTEKITHVLSIGRNPTSYIDGIVYERLSLTDREDSNISFVADRACEAIDAAVAAKQGTGRVLIHCVAGISRSPAMVAAYLMKRRGMTLRESLEVLVRARDTVAPNPGFMRQLCEMEKEIFEGESTFDPVVVTANTRLASWL
ncbi:protein-tyrosine phosphatase-like protein [Podospora didyma]|uniref:protein-tyrosine-phosphatase n=1 Tax=Podospora didyma TaxID=330526 RepID=A0AAE0U718_9PEZI|nr:protein-tyrosine phosphatase-like protein [Podospora didyma]